MSSESSASETYSYAILHSLGVVFVEFRLEEFFSVSAHYFESLAFAVITQAYILIVFLQIYCF